MSEGAIRENEAAIEECLRRFTEAWNAHDERAFALTFQMDASFTNVFGMEVTGRGAIERFHGNILKTMFRDSRLETTTPRIRFLRPDVAAVAVSWRMSGAYDPEGKPWSDREGLISLVMTPDEGDWKIAVMHNMDLPPAEKRKAIASHVAAGPCDLRKVPFDPEFTPGARNAVECCLRIRPDEKVTLITDVACAEIAAAIAHQLEARGIRHNAWILEELAPRPLVDMPQPVLDDMETSEVSIFAVQAQTNELRTRMQMTDVVNRRKMRHAHMVNIDRRIMLEGMRANFEEVDRISTQIWQMAGAAREIRATTPAGTDLIGRFSPKLKWVKTSGIISPNKWGNLPGGETFTSPERVDGTFVVDGVVGDYLCEKYGDLAATPLTVRIRDSRLIEVHSANKDLEDEFWRYCHKDENSDRVGEFAIGTNIAVRDVIGNILQDEKIPGVHIAFGNPYSAHTGADWYSSTHIDIVGRRFDIWIDGLQIMHSGAFLLDSLVPAAV